MHWSRVGERRRNLPDPVDIPLGPNGVEAPSGASLPVLGDKPAASAPTISAVSEITFPDETLVITGEGLDGAQLKVCLEGHLLDVKPLRAHGQRMQATLPAKVTDRDLP